MRLIYWLLGLDDPAAIEQASEWIWYAAAPTASVWIVLVILLAIATGWGRKAAPEEDQGRPGGNLKPGSAPS